MAIRIAIDESANEVFRCNVNDIGSTAAFSSSYLIQTRDAEFGSNDFMIKLVGTSVDANGRFTIDNGMVVYNTRANGATAPELTKNQIQAEPLTIDM